jgi:hypothetical protein
LSTAIGALLLSLQWSISGGVVTIASLSGLFALIYRLWSLGRDRAILELFLNTYSTLFSLCRTPEQFEFVLKAMLDETVSLRRHLAKT